MTTRRDFLRAAGGIGAAGLGAWSDLNRIAAAASLGSPKALGEDYRALVCVFLFGGNDGNNMVVPTSTTEYQQYASGRTGALALSRASLLPINVANTPGRTFGLHGSMAGLQGLFNQGKAAVVANVGPLLAPTTRTQFRDRSVPVPNDLYSHSDQQAQWQSSISDGAPRSGWGGRIGDLMKDANGTNNSSTLISVSGNNLFEVGTTLTSPSNSAWRPSCSSPWVSKPPMEAKNTWRFRPRAARTETRRAIICIWLPIPVLGKTVVNGGTAASAEASTCWFWIARWMTSFQAPSNRFTLGTPSRSVMPRESGSVAVAPL